MSTTPRQAVLIVSHSDGYLEVFAGKNVDVHFARMPQADSRRGERIADVVMEMALPLRYRTLYDRSLLRASAIATPLPADVALYARAKERAIKAVDGIKAEQRGQVA